MDQEMSEAKAVSHSQVVTRLQSISDYREFMSVLEPSTDQLTLADWNEIVKLASSVRGRWKVQWLFSTVASPDTKAAEQNAGWKRIYDASMEVLVAEVPDVRTPLERFDAAMGAKFAIEAGMIARGRAVRFWWAFVSHIGLFVGHRLHLHGIGRFLYSIAMFPKGTVGRAQSIGVH